MTLRNFNRNVIYIKKKYNYNYNYYGRIITDKLHAASTRHSPPVYETQFMNHVHTDWNSAYYISKGYCIWGTSALIGP